MATHDFSSEVFINSSTDIRDLNDTLSNWNTYFKIPIQLDPNHNYALSCNSASIANTMPSFHSTEVHFKINALEFVVDNDIDFLNTTALCQYLTNLCSQQSMAFVFSVDNLTKRVRITNNTASEITIDLGEKYLPFWKKMGFRYDLSDKLSGVTIEAAGDILLRYITRLVSTQRVFITCSQVKNNSYYPTVNNVPIIAEINITGAKNSYSFQLSNYVEQHDLVYSGNFSKLSFTVLDDQFREIELRGGGVNLSLVVKKIVLTD